MHVIISNITYFIKNISPSIHKYVQNILGLICARLYIEGVCGVEISKFCVKEIAFKMTDVFNSKDAQKSRIQNCSIASGLLVHMYE